MDRNRRIERANAPGGPAFHLSFRTLASFKSTGGQACRSSISTTELAGILDRPDLRLFDCTTYLEPAPEGSDVPYIAVPGDKTFAAGHIPGADFLDLQGEFSDQDTELRFMMPDIAQLEAAFGRHGVGADSRVVLYSIGTPMWATRFWWMLRSLGFDNVAVLDGGFDKWKAEERRDRDRAREGISAGEIHGKAEARLFRRQGRGARRRHAITAPSSSMRSARNSTKAWSRAAMAGPDGFPAAATYRPQRCSIPRRRVFVLLADAEAKFATQGLRKDKRVIAYCGGGISATIDLFLLHRLGYDNLTLYDASMGEWAKDEALPIETD